MQLKYIYKADLLYNKNSSRCTNDFSLIQLV